jgi:tetratricopeptide (TPR) repeat protein
MHRLLRLAPIGFLAAGVLSAQTPHLGSLRFPTSATGRAQDEFVNGVLYLHSFEYASALAAFRRAEQLDPGFAMAYWGEAMTYTHPVWNEQDTAAAGAALRRLGPTPAARAAKAPTARERAYLAAIETLYSTGSKASRDSAYGRAMEKLAAAYPTDAEAQAFYALALLGLSQGARDVPTYMRAGAIAESLFAALPNHPGAAHYVIHAFDDPVHAPLGLRAARAYSTIAPDAAHAQHMTSHIFLALGMWNETAHANEIATAATHDSAGKWTRGSCGHYGEWLQYAYLQMDRARDAQQLLDECREQTAAAPVPRRRTSLALMRAVQIIDGQEWNGAAARLALDTARQSPVAHRVIAFANGYAAIKRGDTALARASLRAMTPRGSTPGTSRVEDDGYGEICRLELEALLGLDPAKPAAAIAALTRAAAIEDSLPVDFGPPLDIKPPRELLGEVLLQLGRPAEARVELERQLARTPKRALTEAALKQAMARVASRQ